MRFALVAITALLISLSLPAFAQEKTIVDCRANVSTPDIPGGEMNIQVVQKNGEFMAYQSTKRDGISSPKQLVNVDGMKGEVREGLTGGDEEAYGDTLTPVERLISHAVATTNNETLKDYFNAGFDLTKVRNATVYLIDPRTEDNIGSVAVIVAHDSEGKLLGSFLGGFFVRPCNGEAPKATEPQEPTPRSSELMGFKKVDSNSTLTKFSFADVGNFIVSSQKFSSRDDAIKFCQSQVGYALTSSTLPGVLVFSGFDFDELKSNIIDDEVLTNKNTFGGEFRSGIVFFTKDKTEGSNGVYEMRNGCGDLCEAVEPISDINARLAKIKKPALAIPAICTDSKLEDFFSK